MSAARIKKIRTTWPDKIPCVVLYGDKSAKFIMPCEFTIAHLLHHTRRRLKKIGAMRPNHEKAIFLFHNNKLASGTTMLAELDTDPSKAVTFLCQDENVFGSCSSSFWTACRARCGSGAPLR